MNVSGAVRTIAVAIASILCLWAGNAGAWRRPGLLDQPGQQRDLLRQPRRLWRRRSALDRRRDAEQPHRRGDRPRRRQDLLGRPQQQHDLLRQPRRQRRRRSALDRRRDGERPYGVAIDPAAGRIYWANNGNNTISFANLDGTGGGQLSTAGATVGFPSALRSTPPRAGSTGSMAAATRSPSPSSTAAAAAVSSRPPARR